MSEPHDIRLKRLAMRSHRRGIKEMDIILGHYADEMLATMAADALDLYEVLLDENDQDLYQWVSRQIAPPEKFAVLIGEIADHAAKSVRG